MFSQKLIFDNINLFYNETRLQGLLFMWHPLAGPVDPLGPMEPCQNGCRAASAMLPHAGKPVATR